MLYQHPPRLSAVRRGSVVVKETFDVTVADRRAFLGVAAVAGVAAVGAVAGKTDLFSGHAAAARDLGGVDEPQFAELTPFKDALRIPPPCGRTGLG